MSKLRFPAAERNREPILRALREVLPEEGLVLEVASGSGQHVVHFAAALPGLTFQPTDVEPAHLESVRAWIADAGVENVREPIFLDATAERWPVERAAAIYCANMIHIAPWEAALGLLAGAGRVLEPAGVLCLYGPFAFDGRYTAESNAAFDRSLQARDPRWGVRDLEDVAAVAAEHGLERDAVHALPANNHVVVFRKTSNL